MNSTRAGITLMEVLISIGILAVGLTAVITIIPAAGSQAQKALTESTKANAGLAAMGDAITRGILTLSPNAIPCVVDPIGNNAFAGLGLATLDGLTGVELLPLRFFGLKTICCIRYKTLGRMTRRSQCFTL